MKSKVFIMAITWLLVICCFFISCESGNNPCSSQSEETQYSATNIPNVNYYVIIADSCEYIRFSSTTSSWGGHKGNCKFCAERNKK